MPRRDEYDYEDDRRDDDRRDDGYDDYERTDRPRGGRGRERAAERVGLPAIFLMIVGGLGMAMCGLNLIVELSGMNNGPNPFLPQQNKNDPSVKVGQVIGFAVQVIWSAIVFLGGMQMKNLKSRGFVIFSCIWAFLPCNMCCLLGIPFGIWALVVVCNDEVKRHFT
jgi:hypothetical protein